MAQTDFPFAAVIFDMDGVIVDTEKFYLDTLARLIEAEGIEVPFEDLCVTVGASYKDFKRNLVRWFELGGEHLAEEEALARYNVWEERNQPDFAALLNHGVVETIAELKRRGVRVALASSSPMSNILLVLEWEERNQPDFAALLNHGVVETIAELKRRGVRVALASSSPMSNILLVLEACGLSDAFELVTSGEQFHESKPNPEIYLHTLENLGLPAGDCCCVEDSVPGITAGKAAGLAVFAKREDRFGFTQEAADRRRQGRRPRRLRQARGSLWVHPGGGRPHHRCHPRSA